jgi:hypothetical protein
MFCTDATILEHYHQKQQEFGHQEKGICFLTGSGIIRALGGARS